MFVSYILFLHNVLVAFEKKHCRNHYSMEKINTHYVDHQFKREYYYCTIIISSSCNTTDLTLANIYCQTSCSAIYCNLPIITPRIVMVLTPSLLQLPLKLSRRASVVEKTWLKTFRVASFKSFPPMHPKYMIWLAQEKIWQQYTVVHGMLRVYKTAES